MEIKYISKDVSVTPARKSSTEEKLSKFSRYFRNREALHSSVTIKVLSERQVSVEVSRQAGTVYLRAKAIDADYYNAIDKVVEKLEGQRRKRKTQLAKNHKKNKSFNDYFQREEIKDSGLGQADFEVVKRKSLSLAPMDRDEALARRDALGHSFFIYLDSATGLVNVLYERDDHSYGVIEIDK